MYTEEFPLEIEKYSDEPTTTQKANRNNDLEINKPQILRDFVIFFHGEYRAKDPLIAEFQKQYTEVKAASIKRKLKKHV